MTTYRDIINLAKDKESFLMYFFVGGTGAIIYIFALAIILEKFQVDYRLAVSIAYILGTSFHFFCNKFLTFNKPELSDIPVQIFRYIILSIFSYTLSMLIVIFIVERLHYSPYHGVVGSIAVTMVANYLIAKHWVFTHTLEGNESEMHCE